MEILKKISITKKLIIGFTFVLMVTISVGIVGNQGMNDMMQAQDEFISLRIPSLFAIETMVESIRSITVGERGMMIHQMLKDPEIRKTQYSKGAFNRIKERRAICDSLKKDDTEDSLWQVFDTKLELWMQMHDEFILKAEEKAAVLDKGELNDSLLSIYDNEMRTFCASSTKNICHPCVRVSQI